MAVRKAWFMTKDVAHQQVAPVVPRDPQKWQDWPLNVPDTGLDLTEPIQKWIDSLTADTSSIQYYASTKAASHSKPAPRWKLVETIKTSDALELRLLDESTPGCHFYVARILTGATAKMLGHYLNFTPRVFRPMQQVLTTGNATSDFMFFGIEFMDMYIVADEVPPQQLRKDSPTGQIKIRKGNGPLQSRKGSPMPRIKFMTEGDPRPHTWCLSRIVLAYSKTKDPARFKALCLLDPADDAFDEGLSRLLTRPEPGSPDANPTHVSMAEAINDVMYIITLTWRACLDEATEHLKVMSSQCMDPLLSFEKQLEIMKNLHGLRSTWTHMGRRITGARELCKQLMVHPFFVSIDATAPLEIYLKKIVSQLDEHLERVSELQEETSILVSLIFNIATLYDTNSAMTESKTSNDIARLTQRISAVAFIYLPLGLSASLFGMNVREINDSKMPVWQFGAVTAILVVVTVFVWAIHRPVVNLLDRISNMRPWRSKTVKSRSDDRALEDAAAPKGFEMVRLKTLDSNQTDSTRTT